MNVEPKPSNAEKLNEFIESRISQFALEIPTIPYDEMGAHELEQLCRKKGLRTTGTKAELISRLQGTEEKDTPDRVGVKHPEAKERVESRQHASFDFTFDWVDSHEYPYKHSL